MAFLNQALWFGSFGFASHSVVVGRIRRFQPSPKSYWIDMPGAPDPEALASCVAQFMGGFDSVHSAAVDSLSCGVVTCCSQLFVGFVCGDFVAWSFDPLLNLGK